MTRGDRSPTAGDRSSTADGGPPAADRPPTRDVRDALASHATDCDVRRTLHNVPPHAVYEVTVEGTRAVCKIARGPRSDPVTEARVVEYVRAHTPVPVPRVLAVGPDHFVAEWHDGVPDDPSVDEQTVRAMGQGLATVHAAAADFDATGDLRAGGGRLIVDADERWSDTLVALLADRRDYLDGVGYGDVAREALAFVRDHREVFDAVEDATLVHGNYLPEHVGVEGGEVACVVDFEHALVAPGEWDVVRTVLPLFGGGKADEHDVPPETFRDAYESVRPLPPGFDRRLRAYRAINAVSYLTALHVQRTCRDSAEAVARRARTLREYARSALVDLREELG